SLGVNGLRKKFPGTQGFRLTPLVARFYHHGEGAVNDGDRDACREASCLLEDPFIPALSPAMRYFLETRPTDDCPDSPEAGRAPYSRRSPARVPGADRVRRATGRRRLVGGAESRRRS